MNILVERQEMPEPEVRIEQGADHVKVTVCSKQLKSDFGARQLEELFNTLVPEWEPLLPGAERTTPVVKVQVKCISGTPDGRLVWARDEWLEQVFCLHEKVMTPLGCELLEEQFQDITQRWQRRHRPEAQ
ncbi:hypothetical protein [Wenjunlia tyrosinilytica]|uniref:Uncharacterized protein n=1 Tax=Wenjunlia tyrosinilytica TaxID=1544741 RepID=A0A917ZYQ8_9ACTN|nr:hypothetical protein [Wenjunlia tyrosinilytica]GGP00201.1 hypothetical protein GCM10012280_68440 [Wenjunlia tyrosinilytica]